MTTLIDSDLIKVTLKAYYNEIGNIIYKHFGNN